MNPANHIHPNTRQAVAEDFNGSNHCELTRKYNLPLITIYYILRSAGKTVMTHQPSISPTTRMAILEASDGTNHAMLAQKYRLAEADIDAISRDFGCTMDSVRALAAFRRRCPVTARQTIPGSVPVWQRFRSFVAYLSKSAWSAL